MKLKKLLGTLHLWIGLVIGLLFFVIALSGAIYTWVPEISRIAYKQAVESQNAPFVSVSKIKTTLDREFPKGDFRTVLFRDSASTAEVLLYVPGTYYHASINPYTGKLVHLRDMKKGWLNQIKFLHRNLMLGDIGREIVHWVTLLSLIMLITGIVLWWPTNKAGQKQRLTIKWKASPKRLNYDLHNVLGFYATWIVIFIVITGIFWGFDVVKDTLRVVTGENTKEYIQPLSAEIESDIKQDQFALMDSLAIVFREKYPQKMIRISNPHQKTEPLRVVLIDPARLVYNTEHFYFDRYNGQQITGNFENGLYAENSLFHSVHGLVYDIHFGNILGFSGRLLVFFASLIAASLPITGFLVWWWKRKR